VTTMYLSSEQVGALFVRLKPQLQMWSGEAGHCEYILILASIFDL
jgi:hypothetical protein